MSAYDTGASYKVGNIAEVGRLQVEFGLEEIILRARTYCCLIKCGDTGRLLASKLNGDRGNSSV